MRPLLLAAPARATAPREGHVRAGIAAFHRLAPAFCIGVNRARADDNRQRPGDSASSLEDLVTCTRSLAAICQGS